MMTYTATVTSQGQVTIPAEIRNFLGVKNDRKIVFIKENDRVFFKKRASINDLIGIFKTKKRMSSKEERELFENYLATRSIKNLE